MGKYGDSQFRMWHDTLVLKLSWNTFQPTDGYVCTSRRVNELPQACVPTTHNQPANLTVETNMKQKFSKLLSFFKISMYQAFMILWKRFPLFEVGKNYALRNSSIERRRFIGRDVGRDLHAAYKLKKNLWKKAICEYSGSLKASLFPVCKNLLKYCVNIISNIVAQYSKTQKEEKRVYSSRLEDVP